MSTKKLQVLNLPQSDWNQNDETAIDYVKNRTHWEKKSTEVVCSGTFEGSYYDIGIDNIQNMPHPGDTCHVVFDNIEYECVAFDEQIEGAYTTCIGNKLYINNSSDGTGEPFILILDVENGLAWINCDSGAHTFSIEVIHEEIHPIDPKYLPDNIQSNWNQNDPDALDYVKNRPCYTSGPVETIILEEQVTTIDENNYGFGYSELNGRILFTIDETYIVNFNGTKYECVAFSRDDSICLGNSLILGDDRYGSDAPFIIGCHPNYGFLDIVTTAVGTYTISISVIQEHIHHLDPKYIKDMYYEEEKFFNILQTTLRFENLPYGNNFFALTQAAFELIQGETYRVTFDNIEYLCICIVSENGDPYLGNYVLLQDSVAPTSLYNNTNVSTLNDNTSISNELPFCIGPYSYNMYSIITTTAGEHTVKIEVFQKHINQIKDKYIPDNISRVGHTHPPAEIKNKYFILTDVETNSDYVVYIKNGNFVSSLKCLGIEVKVPPIKTEYAGYEPFDPTGMVVVAKYSDGSEEILNNKLFSSVTATSSGHVILSYTDEIGSMHIAAHDKTSFSLVDFEYLNTGNGTYTLTNWKQTLNGKPSTELIIPDDPNIIL